MANNVDLRLLTNLKEVKKLVKDFRINATENFKKLGAQAKRTQDNLNRFGDNFKKLGRAAKIAGGAIAGAFVLRGVINGIRSFINESTKLQNSLIGVQSVAGSFDIEANKVKDTVLSLAQDGLVPVTNVANTLKNLLATGLNLEESTELFNALKDSAAFGRQGFLSLGEAIEGASQGIKNNISNLVDNAGITKNLSVLQKEYAASLGTTIGNLTEAQKVQAIYTGILREAAIFSGDAAKLTQTYTGAIAKLDFSFVNLRAAIGNFLTDSPAVIAFIQAGADAFNGLTKFINENGEEISQWVKSAVKGVLGFARNAVFAVDLIITAFRQIPIRFNIILNEAKLVFVEFIRSIGESIDKFTKFLGIKTLDQDTEILGERFKNLQEESKRLAKELEENKIGSTVFGDMAEGIDKVIRRTNNAQKAQFDFSKSIKRVSQEEQEARNRRLALAKELQNVGKSQLKILEEQRDARLKIAGEDAELRLKIEEDFLEKKNKLQEQDLKKEAERLKERGAFFGGLVANIGGGAQGAADAVTSVLTDQFKKGAKSLFGPLGEGFAEAAGPIFQTFAKGPEETRKMVREFAQALPMIAENLILAVPVFVEELANQAPLIIERLADRADDIAIALAKAMPRVAVALALAVPRIMAAPFKDLAKQAGQELINGAKSAGAEFFNRVAQSANAFVSNVVLAGRNIANSGILFVKEIIRGAGRFIEELIKGIGSAIGDLGGGLIGSLPGGNIVTDTIGSIGGSLGFAQGGLVPSGFPNDTFPARLTSGEYVIDRDTTADLRRFLENPQQQEQQQSNGITEALLGEILSALQQPMAVNTSIELNESSLADVILNLNRNNQRLA